MKVIGMWYIVQERDQWSQLCVTPSLLSADAVVCDQCMYPPIMLA